MPQRHLDVRASGACRPFTLSLTTGCSTAGLGEHPLLAGFVTSERQLTGIIDSDNKFRVASSSEWPSSIGRSGTFATVCKRGQMPPTDFVSCGSFAWCQFHGSDGLCGAQQTTKNQQLSDEHSGGPCFPRSGRLVGMSTDWPPSARRWADRSSFTISERSSLRPCRHPDY